MTVDASSNGHKKFPTPHRVNLLSVETTDTPGIRVNIQCGDCGDASHEYASPEDVAGLVVLMTNCAVDLWGGDFDVCLVNVTEDISTAAQKTGDVPPQPSSELS